MINNQKIKELVEANLPQGFLPIACFTEQVKPIHHRKLKFYLKVNALTAASSQ